MPRRIGNACCASGTILRGNVGRRDPETMIVDSTLLSVLYPRQVKHSASGFEGAEWARWGSFAVYGVKLHLLCSTNRVPISYELTSANLEEGDLARRLFGDLAYRSDVLGGRLVESGILLASEGCSQPLLASTRRVGVLTGELAEGARARLLRATDIRSPLRRSTRAPRLWHWRSHTRAWRETLPDQRADCDSETG